MSRRVLFLSNGHGEIAIAARIARELPDDIAADHLALVGDPAGDAALHEVGPRRKMPSGGLIAMGNVRNIARDVAGGLLAHTFAQLRFLHSVRNRYDVAIAIGDVFALLMAYRAKSHRTVYVGTAKSVYVAPYGPVERQIIGSADAVFVRDEPTAEQLRATGISAHPGNVIVDLHADAPQTFPQTPFDPLIAVFPGSREAAYADAVRLCSVVRSLAAVKPSAGALLSIAPSIDPVRMSDALRTAGWAIERSSSAQEPFRASYNGRDLVRAWRGPLEAMLHGAAAVLGQAGTANEAAAAAGIPVVAYEDAERPAWYRRRQIGLLGDALLLVRGDSANAAREVAALLDDPGRRAAMGAAGRERMGPPGAARAIAAEIVRLCA